jgi:hypothetical protein
MSGGNSHDRKKFETAVERETEKRLSTVPHPHQPTTKSETVPVIQNLNAMRQPNHKFELGIELCLELGIALYQLGADQMDLPHNFYIGLVSWLVATALAVRMFWILPALETVKWYVKFVIATSVLTVMFFMARDPVMDSYKRHEEASRGAARGPDRPSTPKIPFFALDKTTAKVSERQSPYDLTGNRREEFLKLLTKNQSEPRDTLKIACVSWSENSCVAAGKFLVLFSEAGWNIDSKTVFRVESSIPKDGMTIVAHVNDISAYRKLPPHLGLWSKVDQSQVTIYEAFRKMRVSVGFSADQEMPIGTLGIYFGPEPK